MQRGYNPFVRGEKRRYVQALAPHSTGSVVEQPSFVVREFIPEGFKIRLSVKTPGGLNRITPFEQVGGIPEMECHILGLYSGLFRFIPGFPDFP